MENNAVLRGIRRRDRREARGLDRFTTDLVDYVNDVCRQRDLPGPGDRYVALHLELAELVARWADAQAVAPDDDFQGLGVSAETRFYDRQVQACLRRLHQYIKVNKVTWVY